MASNIYPLGLEKIIEQGLDTMTLKMALMSNAAALYAYDSTHSVFDNGGNDTTDPSFCETTAEDYTAAKAVTAVVNLVVGSTRIEIVITDITWDLLGGSPNETITAAIMYDDTGTPANIPLLAFFEVSNKTTTNQDFVLDFATAGNIRIPYTIA